MIIMYGGKHCPRCAQIEGALKAKKIEYIKIDDEEEIIAKGYMSIPVLDVDGQIMYFPEAFNTYVLNKKGD